MALAHLAATADLSTRGIDSDAALADTLLGAASAIVRRAAGAPISSATSTVVLTGWAGEQWLTLPGAPIQSVSSVDVDGGEVTDHRLDGTRLWRRYGWGSDDGPSSVEVTMTHGLADVPADVVDLVCSLVGAGTAAAQEDYASHAGKVAEMIGDYQVTFTRGAEAVATAMSLPPATRLYLRNQFGNGAGMVTYR